MAHSIRRRPALRGRTDWRIALGLSPDFPLFIHYPTGQRKGGRWAKKVRRKLHHFGNVEDDPKGEAALNLWLDQKDELLAGRTPRAKGTGGVELHELINRFLTVKLTDRESGKISARTFVEYHRAMEFLATQFGRSRLVADLQPSDFTALYAKLSKRYGLATIGREVTMVRTLFNFAKGERLIDREMEYGTQFKSPTKLDKRKARAKQQHERGMRMFKADELQKLIAAAPVQLKAMLLLGANCGFGNTDCAALPLTALDLDTGWLDFPRPKTGAPRRCPLWPETVTALQAVLAERKPPKDATHARLVFLTRLGQSWVRYEAIRQASDDGKVMVTGKQDDAVAKAAAKLLKDLGIKRPGLSFYALRHGFETIAGRCGDQVAVDFIMGHIDATMGGEYREFIDDDRLLKAAGVVHDWLYPPKPAKGSTSGKAAPAKARKSQKTAASKPAAAVASYPFRIVG